MLEYRVERTTTSKEEFMLISHIMGKEVLDKSANKIGLVVDIDYNFPLWTINQLVVRMGILKKINIGVEKIDKIGDRVILKVTKDELVKVIV
jgi:sporulation protein YlmC with PRC-barrel domain